MNIKIDETSLSTPGAGLIPGVDETPLIDNLVFKTNFVLNAQTYKQEGRLVYEYNPFHNMRIMNNIPNEENGLLVDFITKDLKFDVNHPVEMEIQPSFDGSVNVILNDNKNIPRLINSRFTVTENDQYKIMDRKGNNDTNIYNSNEIDEDTRLFKTTKRIPIIKFEKLDTGGSLKAGNYVFYFKYSDDDGNETDIVAESGIIPVYVGSINDPFSIRGGLINEITNKSIKLRLLNIDRTYDFITVLCSRSTGDQTKQEITEYYKLNIKKEITGHDLELTITGFESFTSVSNSELNTIYQIVNSAKTQAQCQSMLFMGNIEVPSINHKEFTDLALRMYPFMSNNKTLGLVNHDYTVNTQGDDIGYYDAVNVYKYTGYWDKEIYRLGVVFITHQDTLSPVFNIRGKDAISGYDSSNSIYDIINQNYKYYPLTQDDSVIGSDRVYIEANAEGYLDSQWPLENAKGVVRLESTSSLNPFISDKNSFNPYALDIIIETSVLREIAKHAKGFFFVRQKRMPTILCQGISIGVDNYSNVPTILTEQGFMTESFIDKDKFLSHSFNLKRVYADNNSVEMRGLISPDVKLHYEYYNNYFVGAEYPISLSRIQLDNTYFKQNTSSERHYYNSASTSSTGKVFVADDFYITSITENQHSLTSGRKYYSTLQGHASDATKFGFFGTAFNGNKDATNLLRGSYGSFLGIETLERTTAMYDIHLSGYDIGNMIDYFNIRISTFSPYYTISDRYSIKVFLLERLDNTLDSLYENATKIKDENGKIQGVSFSNYRGDCYYNMFTTRIQYGLQDANTPTNDLFINPSCWREGYNGYLPNGSIDMENFDNINTSDLNATNIGHWITFPVMSNINTAYRSIDDFNQEEVLTYGQPKAFYPLYGLDATSSAKLPESTLFNAGHNSSTSDKIYNTNPDVSFLKSEFFNRIVYSKVNSVDNTKNGYRIFDATAYQDFTNTYGSIVKLLELNNDILCVYEHGVGIININEKMIGGQGQGGDSKAYLYSYGVLPQFAQMMSTNFGSQWSDSIVRTEQYTYGVDTVAKKIWRASKRGFECFSDFKIQSFLNEFLTLEETDKTPIVGLRNVKTHYDAFKKDIIFTFYDFDTNGDSREWSLTYNETIQKWISFNSWIPGMSSSINNIFFTFDNNSIKHKSMIAYSLKDNVVSSGIVCDNVVIPYNATLPSFVGNISLKGYPYLSDSKYTFVYSFVDGNNDNDLFIMENHLTDTKQMILSIEQYPDVFKSNYLLQIKCDVFETVGTDSILSQTFQESLALIIEYISLPDEEKVIYEQQNSSWFWKHGQAGIFDVMEQSKPTYFYDNQHPFSFEFIVNKGPYMHKILDNLKIISNKVQPSAIRITAESEVYQFLDNAVFKDMTNYKSYLNEEKDKVTVWYSTVDMERHGRIKGNVHYKESTWDVQIKSLRYNESGKEKEARLRDKYLRVRIEYNGEERALVSFVISYMTNSFA